jgi:RNA polymerase sigma-70 factor (ECF subfamily)
LQQDSWQNRLSLTWPTGPGFLRQNKSKGCEMEFWDIYDQHYKQVRKFILVLVKDEWVAEDLIQETFIKVQQNLHQLREESKLSSWIFRIAYNLCQDHFRKTSKFLKNERVLNEEKKILTEPIFQKEIEQHQMGKCVQDRMKLLPEPYYTVLALFDLMDLSHQEIADLLDISVDNVKVRLHRARKKFKTVLEEECRFEVDERNVLICDPI